MKNPEPWKACGDCGGAGLIVGPVDEPTGQRQAAECARCAGTGALILRGLRKGEPAYGQPKI